MIEVKGVTKSFDDFTALDNVTCNIAEGCIYAVYMVWLVLTVQESLRC